MILTAVLVLVTGYYAWQTQEMVQEMRRARGVQVMPRLMPSLRLVGGGHCFPRLLNVGPGSALMVDVEISYEPGGPSALWSSPVVASGEVHDFYLKEAGIDLARAHQLMQQYSELRLAGTCRTALGDSIPVDEVVNVREFWERTKNSNHLQPAEDPIAKQLKQLDKTLLGLARMLRQGKQSDGAD